MSASLSNSRFHMWRAVVALAHADHLVNPEEYERIESYLSHVPFSDEQKETLRADVREPQDPAQMFAAITDPSDQSEFFELARILCWCDGDADAQEKAVIERLTAGQMARLDAQDLARRIHGTRHAAKIARLKDDMDFKDEAHKMAGLGKILSRVYW